MLDAAADLFARRGFAGTSMQDIADALNIRKPSLYKHFDSKDELYGAVLEHVFVPYAQAMDEALGSAEPDLAGMEVQTTTIRVLHDEPRAARLLLQELVQVDRPLHPRVNEWLQLLFDKADNLLALAPHQVGRSALEERLILLASVSVALGFVMTEPLLPSGPVDRDELLALETKILATLLISLRGTPPGIPAAQESAKGTRRSNAGGSRKTAS